MKRAVSFERPDWRKTAEDIGFNFHTMYGQDYWHEAHRYEFTIEQVERDIRRPAKELHEMCREAVDFALRSEEWLNKLRIPEQFWDMIVHSWTGGERELIGRFDFAYDGVKPAKLLEYNADTPGSILESGRMQSMWLHDLFFLGQLPEASRQANWLEEAIVARFKEMFSPGCHVHFTGVDGNVEDRGTLRYLEACAFRAGLIHHYVPIDAIGVDREGRFADQNSVVIDSLFKMYPWEFMFREEFSSFLPGSEVTFIEPVWKAVLSNKGLLPLLWHLFPGHPTLLPAYFESDADKTDLGSSFVRKPMFSREGTAVQIVENGSVLENTEGAVLEECFVLQEYSPLPELDGNYPVVGAWIVGTDFAGIGMREDSGQITKDTSRFVPHIVLF
ncbi:glutathionylspermidine synthase family protein [Thalassospira xianhensis]|uniref:Glutathionylspermidine synthase pre-ATP-grasp-like domain-containing protein n=1 Tax=Thalassospira xianhensis MCCC 1A02616 TaxID=1177929 RepID=A0A367UID5_9PROT|nr:glutathionylspermidine synthase family protein [Thalassospira xianhensis]RCK07790.1 hypothetical protein TH5_01730 [Thalassospira xianhensis MCCC 1A02616]